MFESAELGHKIDKRTHAREEPKLRAALLDAQFEPARMGKFPFEAYNEERPHEFLSNMMPREFLLTHKPEGL